MIRSTIAGNISSLLQEDVEYARLEYENWTEDESDYWTKWLDTVGSYRLSRRDQDPFEVEDPF